MKSAYKVFLAGLCSLFLVACGGGGSITDDGSGTTPPPSVVTVTLSISNTDISALAPATVSAKVVDSKLGALVGELVTFSLSNASIGSFDPSAATALTNSDGIATIILNTATIAGAGTVTGTVDTGESGKIGFVMKGDGGEAGGGAQVNLALTDVNGTPIQTITSLSPGRLTATVTGINKPTIVTFDNDIGDLPIKTAVTNSQGKASVDIYAGNTLGAGTIVASLASGEKGSTVVVVGATNVVMGSGDPFVAGKANVSVNELTAGGTATISVMIQDDQGKPFTQPVDVKFSSACSTKSSPEAVISSPVPSVNGVATTTYLAKGCVGDDPINVTANAGGLNLSATGTIKVLPANVGSIVFLSATPQNIAILGTGGAESSEVKFKVLDTNSNPVSNQLVNFSLNTTTGGIELDPLSATTNSQGIVQTVVKTGTVATSVRVTGTIAGSSPVISSQSSQLIVSTGIPDQDSFSLSASILNAEGWDVDGTKVTVTARLADAFNNPVPDGTTVSFTTEGGAIEDACQTVKGTCSVIWTSQLARPEGELLIDETGALIRNPIAALAPNLGNFYGQKYGGRATITATAIGEESFPDLNGNGRFDSTEVTAFLNQKDVSGKPFDLNDAFNDYNEDGVFNPQQSGGQIGGELEELIDFNSNGIFDVKDNKYNGVLCAEPAHSACADGTVNSKSLYVRGSLVIVMSGSTAYATPIGDVLIDDSYSINKDQRIDIIGKGAATVYFTISDLHNQQMPAGSVVRFTASAGSVASGTQYTWPSSSYNAGREFSVTLKGEEQPNTGTFIVEVETPGGLVTQVLSIPIIIN
ncbi:hypothetical protein [Shewanella sp. CG12_big_fil_rev_8_21_14_0_65_47_15]|uniref:hypothetical protein n=1 Tax=Shewanella sp. CG12_big_fil_rev_8_21_14_0_65_47_15 TaxID=1975537 RepID=UPI000CBC2BB6|nr:hypothetical protein [Shewanella sp. CG12_big_fil_rev_8_21_14_0_65_47_15]PIW62826.1 MAG: hypothetical protein COW15_01300 [Shewanella sp. CG12_big_fil_rev_8_21_14_0_65_47_15]